MLTTEQGLPDNAGQALALGDDGALWVGTDRGGLARLAGGQVDQVLTTEQGLPDNGVSALAPGDGRRALGRHHGGGLARLAGGEQVDQVLTTEAGPAAQRSSRALAPGDDGALWGYRAPRAVGWRG